MTERKDIWSVIVRYLDNTMDAEDSDRLEAWLDQSNENRRILHSVSQIWKASEDKSQDALIDELNLEQDWNRISRHINRPDKKQSAARVAKYRRIRKRQTMFSNLMKVAALILVAVTSGYLTLQYAPVSETVAEEPVFNEIRTSAGERARVELGDGSRVTLNAASKIVMPKSFSANSREVELYGQAFFDIKPDRKRPFSIRTRSGVVEVVGTSFDLRSYEEEDLIKVVVSEGTVEISHEETPDQKLVVNEGYKGTISVEKTHLNLEWVGDVDNYFAWMEGRLIFKEEYLKDVFTQIERWYDVQIEVPESELSVLEKQFSADLKTRSVREVMNVIQMAMGIEYEINDDHDRIQVYSGRRM
jgi:transmembrane sensor